MFWKRLVSAAVIGCLGLAVLGPIRAQEVVDPMQRMVERGIFEGDSNGDLRSDAAVTRGEFCKIVAEAFGLEKAGTVKKFQDIDTHWAKDYVEILASHGYIHGVTETQFQPDGTLTYEQALAILMRVQGIYTGNYPYDCVAQAVASGTSDCVAVVIGAPATRKDIAQLLCNILERQEFDGMETGYQPTVGYGASGAAMSSAAPSGGGSGGSSMVATDSALVPAEAPAMPGYGWNTESYAYEPENGFRSPVDSPLSTFALDVDTASYSNLRRKLVAGQLPEAGVVRTEELLNYFDYDLPQPEEGKPFSVYTEVAPCPWDEQNQLAMVALKGYELERETAPASNLVFLIDVSGSMFSANKLPLAQQAMLLLTDTLRPDDRVTIVTYAGNAGVVLDTVSGENKEAIREAIYGLRAGGSTNGAGGIRLAYEKAQAAFVEGGNNRVILCTDGDFNVGEASDASMEQLISEKRESGILLSVLGFGMGNYKDSKMEILADCGNGNYAYIDTLKEAKKVLVDDMLSTIFTIAKDVKLQVEFNPATVQSYRLIGYENRLLNPEDFTDDKKDAGEMGAGDTMVALYEIVPAGGGAPKASELKYQTVTPTGSEELFTVHLRYKLPDSDASEAADDVAVRDVTQNPSENLRFASSVAEFAMLLNHSEYRGSANLDSVIERALGSRGNDLFGYRAEFIQLVGLTKLLVQQQEVYQK